jgi:hypothetical protein
VLSGAAALRPPPGGSRSLNGLAADLDPVDAQQAIEEGDRGGRGGLLCLLPAPAGAEKGSWIAHRVVRAGIGRVLRRDGAGPAGPDLDER